MKIDFKLVNQLPLVIIDNYYDQNSCDLIWKELLFLNSNNKLMPPEKTGSAKDPSTKQLLKKNTALSLDNTYKIREVSNILTVNRKLFEIQVELENLHPFFRYLGGSNSDRTIISYYEDTDYYKPHRDKSTITALSWFFQEPKKFTDGNLVLENTEIECKNNRTVIFSSMLDHEVTPLKMNQLDQGKNLGRFTITQFATVNFD